MALQPSLPIIFVSDYTLTPHITTIYHLPSTSENDNTLHFGPIYRLTKSLLTHPPCYHRHSPITWPCAACETAFTTKYWACAAHLLDYFSDFFAKDTALMQSLWFYLFDVWQETSAWLPVEAVLEDVDERVKSLAAAEIGGGSSSNPGRSDGSGSKGKCKEKKKNPEDLVWGADKARTFEHDIRDALELFETVIWGRRRKVTVTRAERQRGETGGCDTTERTIYDPTGEAWCPVGDYNTGPWISGVKPWNQFLNAGGSGVVEPVFAELEQEDMSGDAAAADGDRKKSVKTKRYIPQPGIAIIATHTERTRSLAEKFFATLEDNTAAGASLQDFNNHAPFFPTLDSPARTYASLLEGHTVSCTLSNGAPPVLRLEGYADPGMLVQDPDWNLVDDSVAICKGLDAYESISGEWDDEEGVFDMWTVVETRDLEEERERGQREEGKLELGEMFDMWCGVDEC